MKKTNKKLASAIVLGLMLAVPVGASASGAWESSSLTGGEYATNTAEGYYINGGRTSTVDIGEDVVFTNANASSNGQIAMKTQEGDLTINAQDITLDGSWTSGAFYAAGGGNIILTAGNIETDGADRIGGIFNAWVGKVDVTASGDITVNGGGAVFAAQRDSSAVAGSKGEVIVKAANVNVDAEQGIWVGNYSSNGNVDDYAKVDITATDENSSINITGSEYVIKAENGSENAVGKAIVNLTADNVNLDGAIKAENGADLTVDVNAATSANINSDIIATNSNVDLNIGNGTFTGAIDNTNSEVNITGVDGSSAVFGGSVAGDNVTAVRADQGGTVKIDVDNIVVEAGDRAYTNVFMAIQDTVVASDPADRASINITADDITGKYETAQAMNVFKAWGGDIDVTADNIYFDNVDVGFAAETFNGAGADLTVNADSIYMNTNDGEAAHARIDDTYGKTATTTLNATGDITLISNTTKSDWSNKDRATVGVYQNTGTTESDDKKVPKNSDSSVSLNAGGTLTIINNAENGNAIYVENGEGDKVTSVTAQGENVVIKGNITATDNTSVVVDGVIDFTGAIKDGNVENESIAPALFRVASLSEAPDTGVTLNMGKGSTWNVTGTSSVSTVNGEGTIKIADEGVEYVEVNSVGNDSKLTIGNTANITDAFDGNNLAGSIAEYAGRFDIAGDKALIYVADSGSVIGETSAVIDADGNVTSVVEEANEFNAGISEMASIGLMAWRAENNDMNKRLGELRNSNGEHGVWARMVRGESEYGSQGIKNVYNTYQLGYDEKLSTNDHWTVGAAISYTDAQSSFANGSGENTSKGLSFYGSYLGDNGEFVDLIAKYARLDNEFDVFGGAGSGDYSTNGYSFSAEFGKRNQLANDFYFEPQVELTYGRVADVDYVTSKQVKVSQDAMDSLVGRVGFAAGKNIKNGNVYVRASYLYDFDGETSVSFTNGTTRTFEEDLGGGWFEFGIGTNINLSDATYLYLDVEKTTGGEVDTNWQWNAGVRYSF